MHLGDLEVDGKTILEYILEIKDVRMWTGFKWLKIGFTGDWWLCCALNKSFTSAFLDSDIFLDIVFKHL
jgi:hypothetical protein